VVHGLANIRDMRKLGRLGTKAIVYFEVVSTLGLATGFALANLFKPAPAFMQESWLRIPLSAQASRMPRRRRAASPVVNFLLGIIPTTIVDAFAEAKF